MRYLAVLLITGCGGLDFEVETDICEAQGGYAAVIYDGEYHTYCQLPREKNVCYAFCKIGDVCPMVECE